MTPADLLALLCCPATRQSLAPAGADLLAVVNARIADPGAPLRNLRGERVAEPLEAGLLRADGGVLYPVVAGIPVLVVGEGIALN